MQARTGRFDVAGPSGRLQAQRDEPLDAAPRGTAVIAHPHPLFGGTMHNKVAYTLARAFVQAGWAAVRFNFRGTDQSEGVHDEGRGEVDDMLAVIDQAAADGPLALAGFSFGSCVTTHVVAALAGKRELQSVVLVGTSTERSPAAAIPEHLHERTLVVHGEQDETVALASVLGWARPQALPVTVVPGAEHFFHGQLPLLKNLVIRHLR
ncbi:alpha/beta fold hydrolase [Ramlibacter sp.]|uniref:alpha/beta hydrolase n=1 Tax=Ramlibacter sp. TaxID=1917967 RepID=UPI00185C1D6E|nr:alpha/beta fold hydrolase [Ramlibacter sp.]MBA2673925.1 alpha/beta fold hydrolase [Ramlibacter sp.]